MIFFHQDGLQFAETVRGDSGSRILFLRELWKKQTSRGSKVADIVRGGSFRINQASGGADSIRYEMAKIKPQVIAVAGGKGGVGKSLFASMLSICLASFGRRTVAIDMDFNGANLYGYLNINDFTGSLNSFWGNKSHSLVDMVQNTQFPKLDAIPFRSDLFDPSTLKSWQQRRFLREMRKLNAEFVIVDIGSASEEFSYKVFLNADIRLVLSTSDMFSVLNTFSFIRSALYFGIRHYFRESPAVHQVLEECGQLIDGKLVKPLDRMRKCLPATVRREFITGFWQNFRPKIVLNGVRPTDSLDDFKLLGPVVQDLLDVDLDYWGQVRFDLNLREAVLQRRPDQYFRSFGKASSDVFRMVVRRLLAPVTQKEVAPVGHRPLWKFEPETGCSADKVHCRSNCLLYPSCSSRGAGNECLRIEQQPFSKAH